MQYITEKFDYKNIFFYFEQLTKIPHGSGNVDAISNYLLSFAREHGAKCRQDEKKNVVVFLPATKGYENRKTVMLQGHMDMVCEKDSDCAHDFKKNPLDLYIEDGRLRAAGTTLGGDDGIAIAYMMALIADKDAEHPAMELVMTTDEETGMYGAQALDTSDLKASYLINIDSEEEGRVFCGCAGGLRQNCVLDIEREEVTGTVVEIRIKGLIGGHSGVEIDKNRTNANKLMARLLFDMRRPLVYNLLDIHGGKLDNAIPREAFATVVIKDFDIEEFKTVAGGLAAKYKSELDASEPGLDFEFGIDPVVKTVNALTGNSFGSLLYFMIQSPNGVQKMSSAIPGLVESSLNMGIVFTEEKHAVIRFSLRSSVTSFKKFMSDKLEYLISILGGESSTEGNYPAWEYKKDSELREVFKDLYTKEYGKAPVFEVMHAGLECGLLFDKCPGLDIISIGPDMKDVHSPNESLGLESAVRVYKFLEKLICALN